MVVVEIIKSFAGQDWQPGNMSFQSNRPINLPVLTLYDATHFHTGQKSSWIDVKNEVLLQRLGEKNYKPDQKSSIDANSLEKAENNLPRNLKNILKSYVSDSGYPNIDWAAEIACTSKRSLQRELKIYGLNYSMLVDQVRFEKALELLKSDYKLIDICYSIGYSDPSHFSRAFKRIAGVSPTEYRHSYLQS